MTEFKADDEVPKILFGIVKVMEMSVFEIKHYPEKKPKNLMTSSIILDKIMKIIGWFLETGVGFLLFVCTHTYPPTNPTTHPLSLALSLTHTHTGEIGPSKQASLNAEIDVMRYINTKIQIYTPRYRYKHLDIDTNT